MDEILIIGHGVVGSGLKSELSMLCPDVFDKYNGYNTARDIQYDIAFICVDTPLTDTCDCDISEVRNAIQEHDAKLYVIKSTVLPSTTDMLAEETGKDIVFSPEFYGATQHSRGFDFNYTILGGQKKSCQKVIQILQKVYDGRHQFRMTDAKTAELVKYMENSFLATKLSFCHQFFNIAEQEGISYEELRELFILDPRINESHTFVYRDMPYWSSHCLNKDVRAIANKYDASLIKDVIRFNVKQKGKYNDTNKR